MNLNDASKHIGVSQFFLNYLLERNLILFLDKDDISMVECNKYKAEFAMSKLELMDRFASIDASRSKIIDEIIMDELDNL